MQSLQSLEERLDSLLAVVDGAIDEAQPDVRAAIHAATVEHFKHPLYSFATMLLCMLDMLDESDPALCGLRESLQHAFDICMHIER